MKKIFTISVLSVLAVMGTASAARDLYAGAGTSTNLNVATVNYVDNAVTDAKGLIVKSDKKTTLGGSWSTSEMTGSDSAAPTIKYMENSIAEAVADVDTSGLVQTAQVIKADGTTTLAGTTVDAATLNKDTVAPTIANVEANFIPNVSDSYVVSTGSGPYGEEAQGKAPAGSYIVTVDVDENGKATYHWIAYKGSQDV